MIKKRRKKSKLILIALLFISAVSIVSAFWKSDATFSNKFVTSTYGIDIEEDFEGTWGTKRVCFVNKEGTNAPALIRITYNEMWSKVLDETTNTVGVLSNKIGEIDVVTKEWTNDFLNYFTKGPDGWYYYNRVLDSESSVCVLETVTLNEQLIQDNNLSYDGYSYHLDFNFESAQATLDAINTIWGKNVSIKANGEVEWQLLEE